MVFWLPQKRLTIFAFIPLLKKMIKKIVCKNPENDKCIMYQCESCHSTATLQEVLDQELNEHEDDGQVIYSQWETIDQSILTTFTVT